MTRSANRPVPWSVVAIVALGGGLGAAAREAALALASLVATHPEMATMSAINLVGGALAGWTTRRLAIGGGLADSKASRWFAFVVPGFCGGFTSFSGFAIVESRLLEERSLGAALIGLVAGVLAALLAGRWGRRIAGSEDAATLPASRARDSRPTESDRR